MTNWAKRWQTGMTGWHNETVNNNLKENVSILFEKKDDPRILVPLCGKSLDMHWLKEKGASVLGIELVEKAVLDFFQEAELKPLVTPKESFSSYQTTSIEILNGDLFSIPTENYTVDAIYDRASLVALPLDMRKRYAQFCLDILRPGGSILLITYNTHLPSEQGPPHPVKEGIVPELYQNASECILLRGYTDTPETSPGLVKRGLEWSSTAIWHIRK